MEKDVDTVTHPVREDPIFPLNMRAVRLVC